MAAAGCLAVGLKESVKRSGDVERLRVLRNDDHDGLRPDFIHVRKAWRFRRPGSRPLGALVED